LFMECPVVESPRLTRDNSLLFSDVVIFIGFSFDLLFIDEHTRLADRSVVRCNCVGFRPKAI
jgi:hypothetical protein